MSKGTKARLVLDGNSLITQQLIERHAGHTKSVAEQEVLQEGKANLALILDLALQSFQRGEPTAKIVERLAGRLHDLRAGTSQSIWKFLIPSVQRHEIFDYLLQDPFTKWSFEKPRGYSGDACLLDIYYKHPSADAVVAAASRLGREIYAYTSETASSAAGRERRDILARTVDQTAVRAPGAEVLAIACGHLREAELSRALNDGSLERWIGLDQDPVSVDVVNKAMSGTCVEAAEGTVRGILRRSYNLGRFDLVYASGLYDYLPRAVGVRLMQRAMEFLKPGGEFLFANFSDEITTDGYMEAFMDWPLILRSADDMWDIIRASVDMNAVQAEVFYGSNRNIVYGRVRVLSARQPVETSY